MRGEHLRATRGFPGNAYYLYIRAPASVFAQCGVILFVLCNEVACHRDNIIPRSDSNLVLEQIEGCMARTRNCGLRCVDSQLEVGISSRQPLLPSKEQICAAKLLARSARSVTSQVGTECSMNIKHAPYMNNIIGTNINT